MADRNPSPLVLLLALLFAASVPAAGQTVEVSVEEENFRQEPMGKRLATVNRGTRLEVVGSQGRWRRVTLEGWIWAPSVAATDRQGYDLVVSADGGENLRDEPGPGARVAARLLEGFLLERMEEEGNWIRVRRTAWMWAPSLEVSGGDAPATPAEGDAYGGSSGDRRASRGDEAPERLVVEGSEVRLHRSPDGRPLADARPGADLTVLAREGEWTRVRLEGWVRSAEVVPSGSASPVSELTVEELKAAPERYRDRRVRWEVQFISLERAEAVRTDFYEGEPFILARPEADGDGFVYVAVPPERLPQVEQLQPLQRIRVEGRVRTGRSALMGVPVLELLALEEVD